jgi:hypothetical protein
MAFIQREELPKQSEMLYLIFKYIETVSGFDSTAGALRDDIVSLPQENIIIRHFTAISLTHRLQILLWAMLLVGTGLSALLILMTWPEIIPTFFPTS